MMLLALWATAKRGMCKSPPFFIYLIFIYFFTFVLSLLVKFSQKRSQNKNRLLPVTITELAGQLNILGKFLTGSDQHSWFTKERVL